MTQRLRWPGIDVAVVALFAAVGRLSHEEGLTLGGWLHTAWPFLVGLAVGWSLVIGLKRPPASLPAGVIAWAATVPTGMVLRQLTGEGTATSFVIVATLVLGVGLLGARALGRAGSARAPRRR